MSVTNPEIIFIAINHKDITTEIEARSLGKRVESFKDFSRSFKLRNVWQIFTLPLDTIT